MPVTGPGRLAARALLQPHAFLGGDLDAEHPALLLAMRWDTITANNDFMALMLTLRQYQTLEVLLSSPIP